MVNFTFLLMLCSVLLVQGLVSFEIMEHMIGAPSFDEFKERQLKNGATCADTLLRAYYERHNALCLVNKKTEGGNGVRALVY